jgi:hypothetical protein
MVEKNEKPYIGWTLLATLERHFKHLQRQTSDRQREPAQQSLATIDQLVHMVDIFIRHLK